MDLANNNCGIVDVIIHAFCLSLFHSLWEAAVLVLLNQIFLSICKSSASSLRYNVLLINLCIFVIVNSITFFVQFSIYLNKYNPPYISIDYPLRSIKFLQHVPNFINYQSFTFQQYYYPLFLTWLLLCLLGGSKGVVGTFQLQSIRNDLKYCSSTYWVQRINFIAQELNIKRGIILCESAIIKVPVVFGYFKPIIIVPLGTLIGLPTDQVKAVLLHELAHIKRCDYLTNIIQVIVESIYFFNPAVLYLSRQLRNERENCCDDIASEHLKDKKSLVRALIYFEEINAQKNALSIALKTKQSQALIRIQRILSLESQHMNRRWKVVFEYGILLFIGIYLVIGIEAIPYKTFRLKKQYINTPILQSTKMDSISKVEILTNNTKLVYRNDNYLPGNTNRSIQNNHRRVQNTGDIKKISNDYTNEDTSIKSNDSYHLNELAKQMQEQMQLAYKDQQHGREEIQAALIKQAAAKKEIENANERLAQVGTQLNQTREKLTSINIAADQF